MWKGAEIALPDKETWYVSAGQGMMATLNMTGERKGYTLVDRGTYIAYEDQAKGKPALVILVEGDKPLLNQYSVIPVNPAKCPKVKAKEAQQFSDWLASAKGQKVGAIIRLRARSSLRPTPLRKGRGNAATFPAATAVCLVAAGAGKQV